MLDLIVRQAAERWGDATCLVAPAGWSLSYRELDRASDEVATGLLAEGLAEGDLVAITVPTSPDHLVALAACAKAGLVAMGVNVRLTDAERATVLTRTRPAFVIDAGLVGSSATDVLGALRRHRTAPPALVADDDRPIAVVLTSGTTGGPKGAVFAGRQLRFITETDTGMQWGAGAGSTLGATSLAHLGPTTKFAGSLVRGGTTHQVARWRAGDALRLTAQHRMATVAGIPTQLALMLHHPDFDSTDLASVRAVVIGGGPATPDLLAEIRARLHAPVAVRYACTEAGTGLGTTLTDPPEDAEVSVGRPHGGVELAIRPPEGSGADRPPGEVGEVCLRSPAVMAGYWNDPAATAEAFWPDGFVRTGDLGYVDDNGRLVLVGRAKELYVRGGYNVYPMEVEAVLATHPAVAEVAVVARPDPTMGEVGVAFIVATDPAGPPTLADLQAWTARQLARHKWPEDLVVVDALPLTPMEKIDKAELRRRSSR